MQKGNGRLPLTVCGSFGFGNAGDEALPLAIADLAEALNLNADIQVLGRFEQPALAYVIGLGKQDRQRRESLRGRLCLVTGGGVIEANSECVLSRCAPYLQKSFMPTLALYTANVEAGATYSWRRRWQIANILRRFARLYVRDIISAHVLRSLLPGREVEVIGDSVLWLKPTANLPSEFAALGTYIVVTLASNASWYKESAWYDWIAHQLSALAQQLKATLVFVPFSVSYSKDIREHRHVAEQICQINSNLEIITWENPLDPRELSAILGHALLTISMRLHGCVMAYGQKTPFVGLAYHPKVMGFAQTVGWEKFCLPQMLPKVQSAKAYGYSFADTQLANSDLVKTAFMALDHNNFDQLDPCKQRLAEAFLALWELHKEVHY